LLQNANEHPLLSQAALNIEAKVRSNLFPWRGQFSPQLIDAHLEAYAKFGDVVLDPFVGSGTVLVECAKRGIAAFGSEINPAAATMARTYLLTMMSSTRRVALLRRTGRSLDPLMGDEDLPLFAGWNQNEESDIWRTLLRRIREMDSYSADRILLETLVIILDYRSEAIGPPKLRRAWNGLRELVEELPQTRSPVSVALADARSLPIPDGTVDFVLTSPPYINVFNYHQQYRPSVEALGWVVLPLARSEIGSNRKHRANRFLTVIQYCLDMAQTLRELGRVCRPGARAVFVVGRESNVRKTAFYNGEVIRRLATECLGLTVLLEQERVFQNRFGQDIYEDLIHLLVEPTDPPDLDADIRDLARDVLRGARNRAPKESLPDLEEALTRVYDVSCSDLVRFDHQPERLIKGFSP
jgi:SAM-dependent methyltransferase